MIELDHLVTQSRSRWNIDFLSLIALLSILALQFFKGFESRLGFRLTSFGILPNPFQLAFNRFLTSIFRLLFLLKTFFFGV